MKKLILPTILSSSTVLAHEVLDHPEEPRKTIGHIVSDFSKDYGVMVFGVLFVLAVIAFLVWLKRQK